MKLARAAGDEDKMKAKEEGEKAALEGKVKDEEATQRQKEKDECKISSMSAAKKECDARVDTLNQQIGMLQAKAGGKGGGDKDAAGAASDEEEALKKANKKLQSDMDDQKASYEKKLA